MALILPKLGAWIAGTREVPPTSIRAARLQILNQIAATVASANIPEISSLFGTIPMGAGSSTNIGTGGKMATASAAYINTCYSMAQDYDDIIWMGHTGHSAVFASLAVAESNSLSFQDAVRAVVIANEIAGRIGASCLLGPLDGQMWTFVHLVGAAAATSSLLGLDADQATNALAIALSQPPFALQPGFFGGTSKYLTAAGATHTGIMAAYLAKNGMTGKANILENGFWSTFSFEPLTKMFDDLGETWVTESLSIKTFPACHYFQTALEGLERISALKPITLENTKQVICETTLLAKEVTRFAGEFEGGLKPVRVSFDIGLALATALQAGHLTSEVVTSSWLDSNQRAVWAWYGKIKINHDPKLTLHVLDSANLIPAGRATLKSLGILDWIRAAIGFRKLGVSVPLKEVFPWIGALLGRIFHRQKSWSNGKGLPLYFPNRVTVERTDGTRDVREIDLPNGSIARDEMEEELRDKFVKALSPRLGGVGALAAYNAGVSDNTDLSDFMRSISP